MKEFIEKQTVMVEEKIKVTSLEIIVTGKKDKPCFAIKYKEVGKEDYNIDYSSYDLNNVFYWKEKCFEIVNQLAEEYKGKYVSKAVLEQVMWERNVAIEQLKELGYEFGEKVGWIPVSERLPDVEISEKTKHGLTIDNGEDFLVTHENGYVFATEFWAKAKRFSDERIVAWMPLPEPYKQEG